jgi:hypothetical protein
MRLFMFRWQHNVKSSGQMSRYGRHSKSWLMLVKEFTEGLIQINLDSSPDTTDVISQLKGWKSLLSYG